MTIEDKLDKIIELLEHILIYPKYPIINPYYPQYPDPNKPYYTDKWTCNTTDGSTQ